MDKVWGNRLISIGRVLMLLGTILLLPLLIMLISSSFYSTPPEQEPPNEGEEYAPEDEGIIFALLTFISALAGLISSIFGAITAYIGYKAVKENKKAKENEQS